MRPFARASWAIVVVAVATAVSLTACNGNGDTPVTPTPTPTTGAGTEASPTGGQQTYSVTVTMTDYKLELSMSSFQHGSYTFTAEQKGQRPHALAIKGPNVDSKTATIQPGGGSQQLQVTLHPGTYELWCPVGNHKGQGMVTTITVS